MGAVHCNQIPVAGILVGRLRLGFLLQTVGRLGTISANQLLGPQLPAHRGCPACAFCRPCTGISWHPLMMNVALQLLDCVLLLLYHGLHQVADRHHPDDLVAFNHRKVANPALGHEMHAILNSLIGCDGNDR